MKKRWIILLAGGCTLFGIIFLVLPLSGMVKIYQIPTDGMSPTVKSGDRVLASRIFHPEKAVKRGQVVVFDAERAHPRIPRSKFIQRVVALPGDTLAEKDGVLQVNGEPLPERNGLLPRSVAKIDPRWMGVSYPLVVPPGRVFVLGDNYPNSFDSRYFGPIPIDSVSYAAQSVVFPPGRTGGIR